MMLDGAGIAGPVALTGGTGFVGARVSTLFAAAGVATYALVRATDARRRGSEANVPVTFEDGASLDGALRGARALVHLAGRAHVLREDPDEGAAGFQAVNVDLTRRLMEAAFRAGVARVVFVSSIGAVATTAVADVTDATVPAPDTPYGRSKLAAEDLIRAIADRSGLGCVILRPPMVYGPGMKGNPLRLFRAIDRGLPLPIGSARNRRSMMYVDNLAAAIAAALRLPDATRDTFVVGDSAPVSSAQLAHEIAESLGRRARLLPVPRAMMDLAGAMGDVINRVGSFPISSVMVDRLFGSLAVDHSRFASVTGYVPIVARRDAMRRSAEWIRQSR